jgi:O-antigen/teichoic acid export membrane protein
VTSVVFPFTSELHAQEAHEKVQELYVRSTKILTLVTLPFAAILFALPGPILRYWLGPDYAAQGAMTLALLGLAAYLNAVSAIPTVTALGIGRPWTPAAFALAGSAINIVANIILIPRYGINGAAFGALLPQALVVPIFVFRVNRLVRFSFWKLGSEAFLRPFACCAVQCTILLLARPYIDNLAVLVAVCFLSLGVFGVLSIFGTLSASERQLLFGELRRRIAGRRVAVLQAE